MAPRLRRSDPSRPGITRKRAGTGFSFRDASGAPVDKAERERCLRLAIPPAWTDVWICPDERGHIQVVGTDAAGRRQYRYHEQWRVQKDRVKFDRMLDLLESLSSARRTVTRDLRQRTPSKARALAAAFRILDTASPRIGSESYLDESGSRGLSTLRRRHARLRGSLLSLRFPGKGGVEWAAEFKDADLATYLQDTRRPGDYPLLVYRARDGRWKGLTAAEINADIRARTGGDFTAKDFRTLHGTIAAATSLARSGPQEKTTARKRAVSVAMREAAEVLGNTPTVARNSYVDPRIVDLYGDGVTIDLRSATSAESQLARLLR